MATGRGARVRRPRHLVVWWDERGARARDYATGAEARLGPTELRILEATGSWTGRTRLAEMWPDLEPETVYRGIELLCDLGLLKEAGGAVDPRVRELTRWYGWNPEAGFFHLGTRDVPYRDPRDEERCDGGVGLTLSPSYPGAVKSYPNAERIALPRFRREDQLSDALLKRRTWRRFAEEPVPLQALSDLLGLTWGVQRWIHLGGHRAALKTSPSGGARQPLEAYVVAARVDGLPPGTYHYGADAHALARLGPGLSVRSPEGTEPGGVSPDTMRQLLAGQYWFASAPLVVFMTALFPRVQSRYPHPRAYRVVMLEAGHFAQTFCLVATRLGLAPFCTAALADSAIERHLGIDGVREAVVYAVGAGMRPEGVEWAPHGFTGETPATSPPAHAEGNGEG